MKKILIILLFCPLILTGQTATKIDNLSVKNQWFRTVTDTSTATAQQLQYYNGGLWFFTGSSWVNLINSGSVAGDYVTYTNAYRSLNFNGKTINNMYFGNVADTNTKMRIVIDPNSAARIATMPNRNIKFDSITTSTSTAINGIIKGNGSNISKAYTNSGIRLSGDTVKLDNAGSIFYDPIYLRTKGYYLLSNDYNSSTYEMSSISGNLALDAYSTTTGKGSQLQVTNNAANPNLYIKTYTNYSSKTLDGDTTGFYYLSNSQTKNDSLKIAKISDITSRLAGKLNRSDTSNFLDRADTSGWKVVTKTYGTTTYQAKLTNPVTGTGLNGALAHWTSASGIDSAKIFYDGNNKLGIGMTTTPTYNISFDNTGAKTIGIEASTGAVAGGSLTISAGNSGSSGNVSGGSITMKLGNGFGTGQPLSSFTINNYENARLLYVGRISTSRDCNVLIGGTSNNATKYNVLSGTHYLSAEEPVGFIYHTCNSTSSNISIGGGGETNVNAVTNISFYTAANYNTVTGTERLRINSSGDLSFKLANNILHNATIGTNATNDKQWIADASYMQRWLTYSGGNYGGEVNLSNAGIFNTPTGGNYQINSVPLIAGVTGYALFANGTSTADTADIFSYGANIGIGTQTPARKLCVQTTLNSGNSLVLLRNSSNGAAATAEMTFANDVSATAGAYIGLMGSGVAVAGSIYDGNYTYFAGGTGVTGLNIGATKSDGIINFYTGGTSVAYKSATILTNKNFGIEAPVPYHRLSVNMRTRNTGSSVYDIFNFTGKNAYGTSAATMRDSSSFSMIVSTAGSPTLELKGNTGNSLFKQDSVKTYFGTTGYVDNTGIFQGTEFKATSGVNETRYLPDGINYSKSSVQYFWMLPNTSASTQAIYLNTTATHTSGNYLEFKNNGTAVASIDFEGDLLYNFIHCVGSADSVNYNTGATQNYYYKIAAGITWRESDGLTSAGDSVKILKAGDYKISIWLSATTSNANDKMRVKLYVNNAPVATSLGRFIINSNGTGNGDTRHFMWYRTCSVNDYLSFRITNQTGARACNITDIKVYVEKVPEN